MNWRGGYRRSTASTCWSACTVITITSGVTPSTPKRRRIDDAWKSYDDHAQLLAMTKKELHRRIRLVKDRGFRCAIYYFDALSYDDAGPEFNSALDLA